MRDNELAFGERPVWKGAGHMAGGGWTMRRGMGHQDERAEKDR